MYKVLLVDDEKTITEGLKGCLDWNGLNLDPAGSASDGESALKLIEEVGARILITDLKMPGMGGIDLIKEARRRFPELHCLVLSGFGDFRLVREAMRGGAENYLLKPVDPEELEQSLREILITLDMKVERDPLLREGLDLLRNTVMNRLVRNEISHREFRRKMDFLDIPFYDTAFKLVLFGKSCLSDSSVEEDINAFRFFEEEREREILFRDIHGYYAVAFYVEGRGDEARTEDKCRRLLERMGPGWICFSGSVITSYRGLSQSYDRVLEGLSLIRILPPAPFVSESLFSIQGAERQVAALDDMADGTHESFLESIEEDSVKRLFICTYIIDKYRRCGQSEALLPGDWMDKLKPALALFHLSLWKNGWDELNRILPLLLMNGKKCDEYSSLVKGMVENVRNHYSDHDLALKRLAEEMGVNPETAGRRFKKETGAFFNDFLSDVRIERACELLRYTNLPVGTIALKTGFMNQSYFFTKFRKATGCKPTQYRNGDTAEHSCPLQF